MPKIPPINANKILKATPSPLKATGAAKLPEILTVLGNQIPTLIQPAIDNIIAKTPLQPVISRLSPNLVSQLSTQNISSINTKDFSISPPELNLGAELAKLNKQQLINLVNNLNIDVCPDPIALEGLIQLRNNIVDQLNRIGVRIEQIGTLITGASTFLSIIVTTLTAIDTAAFLISAALKIPPLAGLPVPGSVTSGLNDVQSVIRKTTFDSYGNSRLAKIQGTLGGASLAISTISPYILTAIGFLNIIDAYIVKCNPESESSLTPSSPEIDLLASTQLQSDFTQNQTTYEGFIIEIEEIPYTPNVTRRRAIGKNQQGIVLIQTELSFTTDNQTLINELKLIIDRDNLKGY